MSIVLFLAAMFQAFQLPVDSVPIEQRFTSADTPMERAAKAMQQWSICFAFQASRYARISNEPAQTVAEAVIGACAGYESAYRSEAVRAWPDLRSNDLENGIRDQRDYARPLIISAIIEHRAAQTRICYDAAGNRTACT